jgi:hypothetical protein
MNKVLVEVRAVPPIPRKKTPIFQLRSGAEWMGHPALRIFQDRLFKLHNAKVAT